jgi:TonB family protein
VNDRAVLFAIWEGKGGEPVSIRMWRRGMLLCCAWLIHDGAIAGSPTTPPHPRGDFPALDRFYPVAAEVWGEEGAVVVHFCVDEKGELSEDPTVDQSSGYDVLDKGALELAKAGSGHYVPGNEAGQAVAGCSRFKIAFVLKDDPCYPTLSRRGRQLGSQSRARAESLQQQALVQHPPDLTHFVPGDPQSLEQLRQFISGRSATVSDYEAFLVEFIGKMDELGRSNDVSETERNAFSQFWQKERAYLGEVRAALLDARALLGTLTEVANYVENTQPAMPGAAGPSKLTAEQRAEIDDLLERARAEDDVQQRRLIGIADPARGRPSGTRAAGQGEVGQGAMALERVAGLKYSPASMPGVDSPKQMSTPEEISKICPYPAGAVRKNEEGMTVVRVHLDETGVVTGALVARPSGYDELDAAAIGCIAKLRYQPASQNGKPLASVARYRWRWAIDWGPPNLNKCDVPGRAGRGIHWSDASG